METRSNGAESVSVRWKLDGISMVKQRDGKQWKYSGDLKRPQRKGAQNHMKFNLQMC